jgi:hypothetical protein
LNAKTLTVLVSCLFPLEAWSAEVAGNVYAAQDGQGLAGAIVYVVSGIRPGAEPTNRAAAEFAVRGGRLVPEVFVVRTGETFVVKNADATPYNVQFQFRENREHNLMLNAGGQLTARADRPELFARIGEDLHRLKGYICVMEHSFYALTDVAGTFAMPDLPAGSYTIEAVHPRQGRRRKEITVTEKKSSVEFMLPGRSK